MTEIMQVRLVRWGDRLGLLILDELVARFGLSEGAQVDVEADGVAYA